MSVIAGLGKLGEAAKNLRAQWNEVKTTWHDDNSRRFEERYVASLLARVRKVELTMRHMATVLQKVRHDCE
jgi:hypothetical protein